MHCDRVRELLSPYLDEALPAQDRSVLAAHLEFLPGLRQVRGRFAPARAHAFGAWARAYAHVLDVAAAAGAGWRAGARLGAVGARALLAASPGGGPRGPAGSSHHGGLRPDGHCDLVAPQWAEPEARFEHDVLAAHMRALLQESPTEVASADTHWIKPWFSGRLDFSPSVADLSAEGFVLLGARLDYVGDRRVGVLVYRRRQHSIDVFVWPNSAGNHGAGRVAMRKGYTLVTWTRQGLTYWAISDLDAGELNTLQRLL